MTVWNHLTTIFNEQRILHSAGLLTLCVALITTLFFANVAGAAPGINQTLSFNGRLLNSSGGVVDDGYYNIQFKIYENGAGAAVGNPGGTLKWTETYINDGGTSGVYVKNGYFSVALGTNNTFGSSVDWNQDTLWLSMNVAGSSASCTTYNSGTCVADGEMVSMKRLTSTPFSLNSARLEGKTASDFIQNTDSLQTANIAVQSASASKIGAVIQGASAQSADILQVKASGTSTPLLAVGPAGGVKLQSTVASTSAFNIKSQIGNNLFTVDTQNSRVGINLGGNNTPNLSGSGLEIQGALRLSGSSTDVFTTPVGSSVQTKINVPLYNPGNFGQIIALGLPSTANATSRAISVFDARTGAHQPTIAVFSPNENQVFGLSWDGSNTTSYLKSSANTIGLQGGGVDILTATNSSGSGRVAIGTGATPAYTLDVGGGTGVVGKFSGRVIGGNAVNNNELTTLGQVNTLISNATAGDYIELQGSSPGTQQTGSLNISGAGIFGGGVQADTGLFRNSTNSTNAFSVQNAASTSLFTVSSSENRIYIGDPTPDSTGTLLVLDSKNTAGDPTGVAGAMYFNTDDGQFRCYDGTDWDDCDTARREVTPKTADYSAVGGDFVIANSSGGSFTVTLPDAEDASGKTISVKKVNSGNSVTVTPNTGQIDNLTTDTITTQWYSQDYFSDGTKWYRV